MIFAISIIYLCLKLMISREPVFPLDRNIVLKEENKMY